MSKSPEKQLEEFLAPLPAWLKAQLEQREYSFSSVREQLESINNSGRVLELRPEFERLLRQIPAQWNEYCKRFNDQQRKIHKIEVGFLKVPKGKAGAPRKDERARFAVALHEAGKNYPQIATELSNKYEEQISPEAVRKMIERSPGRTKSKP